MKPHWIAAPAALFMALLALTACSPPGTASTLSPPSTPTPGSPIPPAGGATPSTPTPGLPIPPAGGATLPEPSPQPSPSPAARVLDGEHPGWKSQDCAACHAVPVEGHTAGEVWACAACHGGNGACDPANPELPRAHTQADDCVVCHSAAHGFEPADSCRACHYAAAGSVLCEWFPEAAGTPSLRPASDLISGCLSWPEEAISRTNYARLKTGVREGEPAVDFTLFDTHGKAYRLAELLRSKPVLLVLGGFT